MKTNKQLLKEAIDKADIKVLDANNNVERFSITPELFLEILETKDN